MYNDSDLTIVYHYNSYSKLTHVESILNKLDVVTKSNPNLNLHLCIVGLKSNFSMVEINKIRILFDKINNDNLFLTYLNIKEKIEENDLYSVYKEAVINNSGKTLYLNCNPTNLIAVISSVFTTPSDIVDFKIVDETTNLIKYDGYTFVDEDKFISINTNNYDEIYDESKVEYITSVIGDSFNPNMFAIRSDIQHELFHQDNKSQFFFNIKASINLNKKRRSIIRITNKGFLVDRYEQHLAYMYTKDSKYAIEFNEINLLLNNNRENLCIINKEEING